MSNGSSNDKSDYAENSCVSLASRQPFKMMEGACQSLNLARLQSLMLKLKRESSQLEEDLETLMSLVYPGEADSINLLRYLLSEGATVPPLTPSQHVKYTIREDEDYCLELLNLFIDHGWDLNTDHPNFGTVLRQALIARNLRIITFLISKGADVNMEMAQGSSRFVVQHSILGLPLGLTPLDQAAASCAPQVLELLLDHGAQLHKSSALHAAAVYAEGERLEERLKVIEFLVGKGMDINAVESFPEDTVIDTGRKCLGTPLQYAAIWNNKEAVKLLLDLGADRSVEGTCNSGNALFWAKYRRAGGRRAGPEIIDLLGAKFDS